jgi:hypothetical protein
MNCLEPARFGCPPSLAQSDCARAFARLARDPRLAARQHGDVDGHAPTSEQSERPAAGAVDVIRVRPECEHHRPLNGPRSQLPSPFDLWGRR